MVNHNYTSLMRHPDKSTQKCILAILIALTLYAGVVILIVKTVSVRVPQHDNSTMNDLLLPGGAPSLVGVIILLPHVQTHQLNVLFCSGVCCLSVC